MKSTSAATMESPEENLLVKVWTRAEMDGKFYYLDILNTIFPEILLKVTSLLITMMHVIAMQVM